MKFALIILSTKYSEQIRTLFPNSRIIFFTLLIGLFFLCTPHGCVHLLLSLRHPLALLHCLI